MHTEFKWEIFFEVSILLIQKGIVFSFIVGRWIMNMGGYWMAGFDIIGIKSSGSATWKS